MIALLLLALALAMDAVVVSAARGAAGVHSWRRALDTGVAFGLAQGLMPLVGWGAGAVFAGYLEAVDHWIAFGLLGVLGLRMMWQAMAEDDGTGPGQLATPDQPVTGLPPDYWHTLGLAALATSIDAAAAGLTLALFGPPLWLSCLVIALVTTALCVPAYWFAARLGRRMGRVAEGIGGVVLVGLGCKILLEHMG